MPAARTAARLVLVLGLVLSTQGLLLLQGAYVLRKDFVAEHLCVNRDRPEADCHGKCHLRKQLDEQQEREEQRAGLEVMLSGVFLSAVAVTPQAPPAEARTYGLTPQRHPPSPPEPGVFRPPPVV